MFFGPELLFDGSIRLEVVSRAGPQGDESVNLYSDLIVFG